jgi:c-di-GMP-binding flagellar brake protein YcgR
VQAYEEQGKPTPAFTAVTRNLSVGGAALECERPLREGQQLRLALFLVVEGVEDERTPPLVVVARVMWTGEGDDGSHTAGVRFENITPAQSEWLSRFLAHTGT